MLRCPKCETPWTGAPLDSRRCAHCGAELSENEEKTATLADTTVDLVEPIVQPPSATTDFGVVSPAVLSNRASDATSDWQVVQPPSATTDFGEVPPEVPSNRASDATSDWQVVQPPSATTDFGEVPPAVPSSRASDATSNWSELSESENQRLHELWEHSLGSANPGMTIRPSSQQVKSPASTQIIRERAVSKSDDPKLPGADYQLMSVLGEGGMGIVYSARQASIDRAVAVKMLKRDMTNPNQRQKFLSEAVVTGELEHPGIVPIYDMGTSSDGSLFYSMKKIHGTPWSQVINRKSLVENLETLLKVCDAVAFAHSRDVIHRDLKPENVMLGDFGEVLIVDWGLAASVASKPESSSVPRATSMGGTPAYMAPEMAIGPVDRVGKHSDVYLLGAILYECITGKMPHGGSTAHACLAAVTRNVIEPTDKTGELLDIALRAMATDPKDRFPSVRAFQEAIREYQSHTESVALSIRAAAEMEKAVASDDYRDYTKALFGFEEAWDLWPKNSQAHAGISQAKLAYANSALRKGDYDLGLSLLGGDEPAHDELRRQLQTAQNERDARQQRLRTARRVVVGLAALVFVAVSTGIVLVSLQKAAADRLRVVAEDNEQEANRQAGIARDKERESLRLKGIADEQRSQAEYEAYVALIGLAAAKIEENAFDRATELLQQCQPALRNWEWGRLMYLCHQGIRQFPVGDRVESVALDRQSERLVTGSRDGCARLWNVQTGKLVAQHKLETTGSYVASVAISPTEPDWVAVGSSDPRGWLRLWNTATGQVRVCEGHRDIVASVAFSRDGRRLLTASFDNLAMLWNVPTGGAIRTFRGHDWWVWHAAFSPDESTLVTASQDGTARLWNVATGEQRMTETGDNLPFAGHRGPVFAAAFSPDGLSVATSGYDKRVLVWKPAELAPFDFSQTLSGRESPGPKFLALEGHAAAVRTVQYSPDGRFLLSASHDNSIKIWHAIDTTVAGHPVKAGTLTKTLRGHHSLVRTAVFSPVDSNVLISGSHDGYARMWSIKDYVEERVLPGVALQGHTDAVLAASFSRTGDYVLTASRDRTAKAWHSSTGREVRSYREGHSYLVSRAQFFPDGKRLLTAAIDGSVRVWSVDTGAQLLALQGTGHMAAAALSPDGGWILTGLMSEPALGHVKVGVEPSRAALWNAETGALRHALGQHKAEVTAAAFSTDGTLAFTGDANGRGNLWVVQSNQWLAKLAWHTARVTAAVFLTGDKRLLTASADGTVCQWDITDPQRPLSIEAQTLKHPAAVTALSVAPDGRWALTGCEDGAVRWWTLDQPVQSRKLALPPHANLSAVAIAPAGRQALTVDAQEHLVRLVDLSQVDETSPAIRDFLSLRAHDALGWSACFSPDGQSIVTVGGDDARMWDLQGQELMRFGPHRTVASAGYSPDAKLIVTAGWDNSARIWNAQTGQPILKLAGQVAGEIGAHTAPVNSACFSPDGKDVLTTSEDRTIKLWIAQSGRVTKNFVGHKAGIKSAAFSTDGRQIVSASADHTARIWDAETGGVIRELVGHERPVLFAAFSDDGQWVVTGGEDNIAKLWNAHDGSLLRTLKGHTAAVTSVAVSPDRTRVLTASADQSAKLWDATNGKEILTLKGHTREVTSVSFSRDGKSALTGSRDGTAIVWPAIDWRDTISR